MLKFYAEVSKKPSEVLEQVKFSMKTPNFDFSDFEL